LKLTFYVMDDWQGHHESFGLPFSQNRRRLLQEAIERASFRYAVSLEMARHYEDRYGHEWRVAHNGIDLTTLPATNGFKSSAKRVLLAGDVNVFRFDAVLAFAQALDRYNRQNANRIEFTILGEVADEYRVQLVTLKGVSLPGRQSHEFCLNAMTQSDLLYLPLAFAERAARIAHYSLPTKLPEYLAAGHPVFFHAPRESALYQVAERYDLKPRLATVDAQQLDKFVGEWTSQSNTDNSLHTNVKRALSEEFDRRKLASHFQRAFA
jgi:hypothetical protein